MRAPEHRVQESAARLAVPLDRKQVGHVYSRWVSRRIKWLKRQLDGLPFSDEPVLNRISSVFVSISRPHQGKSASSEMSARVAREQPTLLTMSFV